MEPHVESSKEKMIFENPISLSILIASLIVAISIFAGAYMIRGGAPTEGSQVAAAAGAPTTNIKISDRSDEPVIGNANAPVTVYEFGDFQCPFCKQFYSQTYADLKTKYIDTGKVKLVFRQFPLTSIHVNAEVSAEAAECANRQGKFETYYDTLYTKGQADGTGLDAASLKTYAQEDGLDMTAFNQCLDGHQTQATVTADEDYGTQIGITGTPSFVINGQLIVGAQPTAAFESVIDAALKG